MPFFPERLIHSVDVLSLVILGSSLLLVALAVGRRISREKSFRRLDDFRSRLREVFDALGDGTMAYGEALGRVRAMLAPAFEQLFLEHLNVKGDDAVVRQMAEDLGLVEEWQRRLRRPRRRRARAPRGLSAFGFLARARSAENLGRIRHRCSWTLLAHALDDPDGDVQRVALRALVAIREPKSFSVLVEYARRTLAQPRPRLSERDLRAALSCFPLEVAAPLLPSLRESCPKRQGLAADVLAEMLAAKAAAEGRARLDEAGAGPEIIEALLETLATADDPDLRARIAAALGCVSGERAGRRLRQLLNDDVWFVRLRAARALGERLDAGGIAPLLERLTDRHWRVRETAARLLARSGAAGVEHLLSAFLSTRDAYAREQIAEELEASGELDRIIARCARPDASRELEFLSEMVRTGQTRSLETALARRTPSRQRAAILEGLAASSDAHMQQWASQMRIQ